MPPHAKLDRLYRYVNASKLDRMAITTGDEKWNAFISQTLKAT